MSLRPTNMTLRHVSPLHAYASVHIQQHSPRMHSTTLIAPIIKGCMEIACNLGELPPLLKNDTTNNKKIKRPNTTKSAAHESIGWVQPILSAASYSNFRVWEELPRKNSESDSKPSTLLSDVAAWVQPILSTASHSNCRVYEFPRHTPRLNES